MEYMTNFEEFNLHPKIIKAVLQAGYEIPTKIQQETIPKILAGKDLRASAQTGTGKTAAFLLPALNRLTQPPAKGAKGPRILVLAPTRELAMQIAGQSEKYGKHLIRAKTVCIGGGVPYHSQMRQLTRPYDVLVATPGRLIDYLHRKKIDLSGVEMLILDEADRMLDMGFIDPVKEIAAATPKSRQTLMFTATLHKNIIKLSDQLLKNPEEVRIEAQKETCDHISQTLLYVDDIHHKNQLLDHLLSKEKINDVIIFTATKRHADQLASELESKGHLARPLHGDMNQRQRTRTITLLRKGQVKILVATDVAARGIDVQSISHVINFDIPQSAEDYVHRIGRTGRAGATGSAFSFAAGKDRQQVKRIEQYTGQQISVLEVEGMKASGKGRTSQGPRNKRPFRGENRGFKSFGKPQSASYGKTTSASYGKPQGSSYGKPQGTSYGKPQGSSYGKPQGSSFGKPQGASYGKPQGASYGKSSSTSFGKPPAKTGFRPKKKFND